MYRGNMANRYNFDPETVSKFISPSFELKEAGDKVRDLVEFVVVPYSKTGALSGAELTAFNAKRDALVNALGLSIDASSVVKSEIALSVFTGANDAAKTTRRNNAALVLETLLQGLPGALLASNAALDKLGGESAATIVADVVAAIVALT